MTHEEYNIQFIHCYHPLSRYIPLDILHEVYCRIDYSRLVYINEGYVRQRASWIVAERYRREPYYEPLDEHYELGVCDPPVLTDKVAKIMSAATGDWTSGQLKVYRQYCEPDQRAADFNLKAAHCKLVGWLAESCKRIGVTYEEVRDALV